MSERTYSPSAGVHCSTTTCSASQRPDPTAPALQTGTKNFRADRRPWTVDHRSRARQRMCPTSRGRGPGRPAADLVGDGRVRPAGTGRRREFPRRTQVPAPGRRAVPESGHPSSGGLPTVDPLRRWSIGRYRMGAGRLDEDNVSGGRIVTARRNGRPASSGGAGLRGHLRARRRRRRHRAFPVRWPEPSARLPSRPRRSLAQRSAARVRSAPLARWPAGALAEVGGSPSRSRRLPRSVWSTTWG